MLRRSTLMVFATLMAFILVPMAYAGLERVGPVTAGTGGFPAWYQDQTGLVLEFCTPVNQAELNDGWCTILPADVPTGAAPEVPFTNYSGEHFYWIATAGNRTNGLLVLALEAAFNTGDPVAGEQVVFGRLRISIPSVTVSGDYKVYTPFGDFSFPGLNVGDRLFFTSDIGITCGTAFDCALNSQIGPFLLPSATPGGAEMPPVTATNPTPDTDPAHFGGAFTPTPYPGTGKSYIADPARIGPVTGSPVNQNFFRIEVNDGVNPPSVLLNEVNFAIGGRVMTAGIPGRVTINRASYSQTPTANKLDVFATAFPTTQGRLPGANPQPTINNPDLGFYPAPCATDPVTGAVTGPPTGTGLLYYQMFNDGTGKWWGQTNPSVIPTQVCVQDLNAGAAGGGVVPAYFLGNVTDEVHINWANVMWDPTINGGTLTVLAASSDSVNQPVLTLSGYFVIDPVTLLPVPAVIGPGGTVVISEVGAPPAKVTVVSTRGGVATIDVTTGIGVPVSTTTPVANADSVTTPEDTQTPNLNVLANDTLGGQALPAGAIVTITAQGRLGTATLNPDYTITYTPTPNLNGTDIIGYKVTVGGFTSNEGYLTIIITPVNDPPVAVNDTAGAPNNKPVTINVLANDIDPDGAADLAAAVIVTAPGAGATLTCNGGLPAGVGTVCAGGLITFTPTVQGTFTFAYQAQDKANALSAPATVSVTVNAVESIVVTRSQYVISSNRWRVDGTDNVISGQTLTLRYTGGTYKIAGACTGNAAGTVIGTAPVDALGNWTFDAIMTSAGVLNPSNTGGNSTGFWCTPPRQLSITSPLGGTATTNITLK